MSEVVKYVINPLTQRPIKKNGKSYYNLLEDGIFPQDEKDERPINKNIICMVKDMDKNDVDKIRKDFNDNNEKYFASVGRGKYEGYLIRKARKTTKDEFLLRLSKKVKQAFLNKLENSESDDEMDEGGVAQLIADLIILEGRKLTTRSKYIVMDN
jgi:hypothetical protein